MKKIALPILITGLLTSCTKSYKPINIPKIEKTKPTPYEFYIRECIYFKNCPIVYNNQKYFYKNT